MGIFTIMEDQDMYSPKGAGQKMRMENGLDYFGNGDEETEIIPGQQAVRNEIKTEGRHSTSHS